MRGVIRGGTQRNWALFESDTYRFLVGLVALLAEGRRVYVPGENHAAIVAALVGANVRLVGQFAAPGVTPIEAAWTADRSGARMGFRLSGEIVVFTSGSTGEPTAIDKNLGQLDEELSAQEGLWGNRLQDALVLGTVSHQHLYGLLFTALWPLCAGRPVWRRPFVDPVLLARTASAYSRSVWIMGPAHLHRLGSDMPWQDVRGSLAAIFSSGGPLQAAAANEIYAKSGHYPVEILGSSETGGMAWREQRRPREPWTPLPRVDARQGSGAALEVRSPFLPTGEWYRTSDAVRLLDDGRFELLGRLDRIAKIEGKRVSLEAVEAALRRHPWILDAATVVLHRHRQFLGAVLVLAEPGARAYEEGGHHRLAQALRAHLSEDVASAAIPRLWRFVDELPRNPMGKVQHGKLRLLFVAERYPQVLEQRDAESGCRLRLRVSPDCPYLEGHFPNQPVLPGVVQVFWADHFARELLGVSAAFRGMQALKFKNLVLPGMEVALTLGYSSMSGRLEFHFESTAGQHSQGRLEYGTLR